MNAADLGLGNVSTTAGGALNISGADLTTLGTYSNNGTTEIANGHTLTVLHFSSGLSGNLVFGVRSNAMLRFNRRPVNVDRRLRGRPRHADDKHRLYRR